MKIRNLSKIYFRFYYFVLFSGGLPRANVMANNSSKLFCSFLSKIGLLLFIVTNKRFC